MTPPWLLLSAVALTATHGKYLTADAAKGFWDQLVSGTGVLSELIISFDVDCYQNDDEMCTESCLYWCAIPQQPGRSISECSNALPHGCKAVFGGAVILGTNKNFGSTPPWNPGDISTAIPDTSGSPTTSPSRILPPEMSENAQASPVGGLKSITNLDLTRFAEVMGKHLGNTDLSSFEEAYLAFPDSENGPKWAEPGEANPVLDDDVNRTGTCIDGLTSSSIAGEFVGKDLHGTVGQRYGLREQRGFLDGPFVSKRGWRLFQQYAGGHWEVELLKNFFLVPINPHSLLRDPSLSQATGVTRLRTILMEEAAHACAANRDLSMALALIFVWRQEVQGRDFTAFGHDSGAPLPRVSAECVGATGCLECQARKQTATGKSCVWCFTPAGQSCEAYCPGSYFLPITQC